jgi:hypothetical protein
MITELKKDEVTETLEASLRNRRGNMVSYLPEQYGYTMGLAKIRVLLF